MRRLVHQHAKRMHATANQDNCKQVDKDVSKIFARRDRHGDHQPIERQRHNGSPRLQLRKSLEIL